MTDEPVPPDWGEQPFRFSKFYLATLFDGQLHLVRRGEHFPETWAKEEIAKRLRSAAWWRGTTVRLSHCPQGVWLQSNDAVDDGMALNPAERSQLLQALDENARLKEENMELRRQVWQLKNSP